MTVPAPASAPMLPRALALLGVALAGGLLAAPPLLIAGMAAAYVRAWLGLGSIDPTWNDGDGGLVLVAVIVVLLLLAAVGVAVVALARRARVRPAPAAALSIALSVAVAVLAVRAITPLA
ncbi:MAG: hypothetical protein AAGC66_06900 [Leifsonia sp.]